MLSNIRTKTDEAPRSLYNNYMRTQGYIQPDAGNMFQIWREATEDTITGLWSVQDVECVPAPRGDETLDFKPVENASDVTYQRALSCLAQFEKEYEAVCFTPCDPKIEEMGLDYFRTLAHHDGFAFDKDSTPHKTRNGRIIGPGRFYRQECEAAHREYNNAPPPSDIKRGNLITQLFRNAAENAHINDGQELTLEKSFANNVQLRKAVERLETLDESVRVIVEYLSALVAFNQQTSNKRHIEFARGGSCKFVPTGASVGFRRAQNDRLPFKLNGEWHGAALVDLGAEEVRKLMKQDSLLDGQSRAHIGDSLTRMQIFASTLHAKLLYDTPPKKGREKIHEAAFNGELKILEKHIKNYPHMGKDDLSSAKRVIMSGEAVEMPADFIDFRNEIREIVQDMKAKLKQEQIRTARPLPPGR